MLLISWIRLKLYGNPVNPMLRVQDLTFYYYPDGKLIESNHDRQYTSRCGYNQHRFYGLHI